MNYGYDTQSIRDALTTHPHDPGLRTAARSAGIGDYDTLNGRPYAENVTAWHAMTETERARVGAVSETPVADARRLWASAQDFQKALESLQPPIVAGGQDRSAAELMENARQVFWMCTTTALAVVVIACPWWLAAGCACGLAVTAILLTAFTTTPTETERSTQ